MHKAYIDALVTSQNCPVVVIDDQLDGCDCAYADDARDMQRMTEHFLFKHHMTHLVFLSGKKEDPVAKQRCLGFCRAMEQYGIPIEKDTIVYGDFWKGGIDEIITRIQTSPDNMPEAILCANDSAAVFLMNALAKIGVKVPEQISVSWFDGTAEYHGVPYSLTTIQHDHYNMGRNAANQLICRIQERKAVRLETTQTRLRTRISCSCGINSKKCMRFSKHSSCFCFACSCFMINI